MPRQPDIRANPTPRFLNEKGEGGGEGRRFEEKPSTYDNFITVITR